MASRAVNTMVEAYRRMRQHELQNKIVEDDLMNLILTLSPQELNDYVAMTDDIDEAAAIVGQMIERSEFARSTLRQTISRDLNYAGRDTDTVGRDAAR